MPCFPVRAWTMVNVRLEITPSLAGIMNTSGSAWFILEEKLEEGASVGDLFTRLALKYPEFRKAVFEPDTGEVSDEVLVVLNDVLLQSPGVSATKLRNGDTIILTPVYSGG